MSGSFAIDRCYSKIKYERCPCTSPLIDPVLAVSYLHTISTIRQRQIALERLIF